MSVLPSFALCCRCTELLWRASGHRAVWLCCLCLCRQPLAQLLRFAPCAECRCCRTLVQWDADKNLLTVSMPIIHDFDAKITTSSADDLD